jgi:hypothetical protein
MGCTKSYRVRQTKILWCNLKYHIKSKISQIYGCGRDTSSRLIVVISLHNIFIDDVRCVQKIFYLLLEDMS